MLRAEDVDVKVVVVFSSEPAARGALLDMYLDVETRTGRRRSAPASPATPIGSPSSARSARRRS
jgi:hypothetical protein